MNDSLAAKPVIVGIDGSATAIGAALWATEEAVSRNVPLRLVCVTKARHPSTDDYYHDIHHAEESLRVAQAAVEATGRPVKVETAMLDGPPGAALVAESRDATMICVGSVGIGQYARSIWVRRQPSSPRTLTARSPLSGRTRMNRAMRSTGSS